MSNDPNWAQLDDGICVPYVERGDPTGVPVVLLHGFAESWKSFELALPKLPRTVRAFAASQRGQGGPPSLAKDYSLGAFAADVGSFMDAVGLDRAVIVGSSSGGYIAQRFAADQPDRTLALILVGSPRTLKDMPEIDSFRKQLATLRDPIDPAFVRAFIGSTMARSVPDEFLETMVAESLSIPAVVWRAIFDGLTEASPPSESATITAPTLILRGDRDGFISRSEAETLAMAIDGSELRTYEGAGHAVLWEEPARVAGDLVAFVEELGL